MKISPVKSSPEKSSLGFGPGRAFAHHGGHIIGSGRIDRGDYENDCRRENEHNYIQSDLNLYGFFLYENV